MNKLKGQILTIQSTQHLSLLEIGIEDDILHLLLLEKPIESVGSDVVLVFKESEVMLSKEPLISTANTCKARIHKIEYGEILTCVTLLYKDEQIAALIPTASFESLNCKLNEEVYWIINPSEISLRREHRGK